MELRIEKPNLREDSGRRSVMEEVLQITEWEVETGRMKGDEEWEAVFGKKENCDFLPPPKKLQKLFKKFQTDAGLEIGRIVPFVKGFFLPRIEKKSE